MRTPMGAFGTAPPNHVPTGGSFGARVLVQLQRAAGNRAVGTLLPALVVQRAPVDVVKSEQQITLDLSDNKWRSKVPTKGPTQVVYVLRDAATGEVLKVGKTTIGSMEGRFEEYVTAGNKWGRKLVADVYTIRKRAGRTVGTFENEIRAGMKKVGHKLPWDNQDRKRPGKGIPTPKPILSDLDLIDDVEAARRPQGQSPSHQPSASTPHPQPATTAPSSKATTAPSPRTIPVPTNASASGRGGLGRQIVFNLGHSAALILLDWISSWLMAKIEDSLFTKDCKKLEPDIGTAINQQPEKIAGLLETRKTIYANVRMEILRNLPPDYSGKYRYFTTKLLGVEISTVDIRRSEKPRPETHGGMSVIHSPFTYSFAIGEPTLDPEMPPSFQGVLDYVASVLEDIQRTYSVAGPRFAELNSSVQTALRAMARIGEPNWTESLAMSGAQRFTVVQSAVDRAHRSAQAMFGANPPPGGQAHQLVAQLEVIKQQLGALNDSWPLFLATWPGDMP